MRSSSGSWPSTPDSVGQTSITPQRPQLVDADGYFRTLPFRDGLEAFFAASLVKAG